VSLGRYAYADTFSSGAELKAAGYAGVFGSVGVSRPGRAANAVVIDDWLASGLSFIGVYRNEPANFGEGWYDGAAHADAVIDDLNAMLLSSYTPICAVIEQHLTSQHQPLALEYQQGFFEQTQARAWRGPVGAYGFGSFLSAVRAAGCAEWFWLVGTQLRIEPWIDFCQDGAGAVRQYRQLRTSSQPHDW
jgi:hypothetical protein